MKKKLITTFLSLSLVFALSTEAFAANLGVSFNGVNRIFTEYTNKNGITYVEANSLCDDLHISYDYNPMNGTLILSDAETTLIMRPNSSDATLNDETIHSINPPIRTADNDILIPLRFVAETFGSTVGYDSDKNTITITNEDKYLSELNFKYDVTEDTKIYSYDDALRRATSTNTSLKQTLLQFETVEANLKTTEDSLNTTNLYAYTSGDSIIFGNPLAYQLFTTKDNLENTLKLEDETLKASKLAIETNLMNALNALDIAKSNYLLTKESANLQKIDLDNTTLKNSLGMVSDETLRQAKSDYEKTLINLSILEDSVKTAKENLNTILNLPVDSDIYVEYDTTIEEKSFDVDSLVTSARLNSLSVKNAENTLKAANNSFNYVIDGDSYSTKMRDLDSAELNLTQTKKDVEAKVRSTYKSYVQVLDNDKTLRANRLDAINTYNNAVLSYNAGYITNQDLEKASLNITNCEMKILQNELNCKILLFQLEHPELF